MSSLRENPLTNSKMYSEGILLIFSKEQKEIIRVWHKVAFTLYSRGVSRHLTYL